MQGVPTLEAGRRLYFGDDRLEEAAEDAGGVVITSRARTQVAGARADDAGVGLSVPEPITDPLSAVLPDGGERARTRLRLAGALLFGAGSLTLAAVLAAPDPDASDHRRADRLRARLRAGRRRADALDPPAARRPARDLPGRHDRRHRGRRLRGADRAHADLLPVADARGRLLPRPPRGRRQPRAGRRLLRARPGAVDAARPAARPSSWPCWRSWGSSPPSSWSCASRCWRSCCGCGPSPATTR